VASHNETFSRLNCADIPLRTKINQARPVNVLPTRSPHSHVENLCLVYLPLLPGCGGSCVNQKTRYRSRRQALDPERHSPGRTLSGRDRLHMEARFCLLRAAELPTSNLTLAPGCELKVIVTVANSTGLPMSISRPEPALSRPKSALAYHCDVQLVRRLLSIAYLAYLAVLVAGIRRGLVRGVEAGGSDRLQHARGRRRTAARAGVVDLPDRRAATARTPAIAAEDEHGRRRPARALGKSSGHRSKWRRQQAAAPSCTCTVGVAAFPAPPLLVGAIACRPVSVGEARTTLPSVVNIGRGLRSPAVLVAPRWLVPLRRRCRNSEQRRWRQRCHESPGELAGSGSADVPSGTQSHRPASQVRERERYAGHHLARTARLAARRRRRRERSIVRSWPAASQRCVEQPAEVPQCPREPVVPRRFQIGQHRCPGRRP